MARECPVHDGPEGIQVRGTGDVARSEHLLGRHVLEGPEDPVAAGDGGDLLLVGVRQNSAHPEVDEGRARTAALLWAQHDVAGLQVAMHHVGCVQIAQPSSDVDGQVEAFDHRQPSTNVQNHVKRLALDELHHEHEAGLGSDTNPSTRAT